MTAFMTGEREFVRFEEPLRAYDCIDPAHEDMHFTAATDEELTEQLLRHRDQYHPQVTDDEIRQSVMQNAYDE